MRVFICAFLFLFVGAKTYAQKRVRYDLFLKDTLVNFTGKWKRAIAANGQLPMPTLVFTEGDTAEIHVHNGLKEATSMHWHGLFLPNKEDGVPYLTQMPIPPNATHIYTFPIIQNGTHWYHSHSGLQEQIGMYGSLVLEKKKGTSDWRNGIDDLPSFPIILSEWTDYKPENVHRMLHNATDWFAIQKGAAQSYAEAAKQKHFGTKINNEWKRMLAMDVSDVYYDRMLANGENEHRILGIDSGQKVRLRITNAGASTYFWLQFSGGKITVVANDGNDVEPVEVDRLLIAVSETYDIVVSLPYSGSFELLATSEDRTKSTSVWIGNGIRFLAEPLPRLKYFEGMKMMNAMMRMNGKLDDMGMQMSLNQMDMNVVMYPEITGMREQDHHHENSQNQYNANKLSSIVTLNYTMLRSTENTALYGPTDTANIRTFRFELSGNMNRYVWSLNQKVVSESDKILIKKGEIIRMVLYNGSMMRHPMHLHGHDFQLRNGHGNYSPLKNVVDIMPMETDTLEFAANTDGDWFFHCHILYHMMSGMGRIFSYENSAANPLIPNPAKAQRRLFADDREFHFMFENDIATNGNDGMAMLANTRWTIGSEWRLGYNHMHGYEVETHVGRYIGRMQWLLPFIGFDFRYRKQGIDFQEKNIFGQMDTKDWRQAFSAGFSYTLPMLLRLETEVFTDGTLRIQLGREDIPISKRVRFGFMVNTDKEYMIDLRYIATKNLAFRTHYDSDMGFGAGITINY